MEAKMDNKEYWFAYRIFHNKMRYVKEQLTEDDIRFFSPVRLVQEKKDDEVVYREVPMFPTLLFIRSTEAYMKALREEYATHLSVYTTPGTRDAAVIPDREMEVFEYVVTKGCERIDAIDEKLVKGNHVRITGGLFEGAEGYIVRIHGTKRFVVNIKGVAAVATTFVPRCFIEKID